MKILLKKTVEKTTWLVEDAVKKQMLSDIPISTFLSGGVDSSLGDGGLRRRIEEAGEDTQYIFPLILRRIRSISAQNSFQPSQDRPWVEKNGGILWYEPPISGMREHGSDRISL